MSEELEEGSFFRDNCEIDLTPAAVPVTTAPIPNCLPGPSGTSANGRASTVKNKKTDKLGGEKSVELGFVEDDEDEDEIPNESWMLASPFFPSKLGGKPSWLDLKNLPDCNQLKCSSCDNPTKFLCQIYAPLGTPETFHRSVFIFVCTEKRCCIERNSAKNLIALRCQLERKNEFYSEEAPAYNNSALAEEIRPEKWGIKLCRICGCKASAHCSKCKKIDYCSKEHQVLDWKSGHKEECSNPDFNPEAEAAEVLPSKHNFKEYEITIDKEVLPKSKSKEKKDTLEDYKKLVQEGKAGTLGDDSATTKELEASSYKSDKAFNKFRKRIDFNPDQILRYDRGGEPLWVSSEKVPSKEDGSIPNCSHCGGPRIFEFQIMPQLLNYVGEESRSGSLDWGTFGVYTCENSCTEGSAYKTEFIWLQHFQDVSIDDKILFAEGESE